MRTTIDIHDPLLERAKTLARMQGVRLHDVVNDALREMFARRLQQNEEELDPQPMPISEVGGRGLQPGIDLEDTAGLADLLDGVEGHDSRTGTPPNLNELR